MKKTILTLAMMSLVAGAFAQKAYFVDGYHGGVYGHYPMEWYTQFIVDQLQQHEDWRIGLEIEPETWDSVRVRTPEAYLNFKRVAGGKQVEFTNPSYAQAYLYNISGESIIRQFAYGIRKVRDHFPDAQIVTYSAEEPCFTSALPQLLALFGFRHAVLKCPDTCWGGYAAPYGKELVNLIGPDGTSMLSVPRYACEALQPNSVWQTIAWRNSTEFLTACRKAGIKNPVGMCYQDAGWKFGPWLGGGGRERNGSVYVRWTDYIEKYSVGKSSDNYHYSQDDVRPGLMWGSQVMQRVGQSVRRAENEIVQAEKMASMAWLMNGFRPVQKDIDEAWRVLMLSQHHDSWICPYNNLNSSGTWSDNIVNVWTPKTLRIARTTIDRAVESYRGRDKSSETFLLRVFNTLGHARNEVVAAEVPGGYFVGKSLFDAEGNEIPFASHDGKLVFKASVPAFGYTTYAVKASRRQGRRTVVPAGIRIDGDRCRVENAVYRLDFDLQKGGIVTSLYDKERQTEYVGNTDTYHFGELRGFFDKQQRFCSSVESAAKATVVEDDSIRKVVRIEGLIAGTPFSQTYTLAQEGRKIDVDLVIDWKKNERIGDFRPKAKDDKRTEFYDTRYMLNVHFPTTVKNGRVYKNAPFDVCESKQDDTFFCRWDSLKHNVILNWLDVADRSGKGTGLMLLSDHTTSYSYGKDYPLSLTAQYSGGGLWTRNYLITGPTRLHYALLPHTGKWDEARLSAAGDEWNEPLICKVVDNAEVDSRSLISVPEGYHLSAVTVEEDGLSVRIFNEDGKDRDASFDVNAPVKSAEVVDLNGKTLRQAAFTREGDRSTVKMKMPRFGLTTFKIKI